MALRPQNHLSPRPCNPLIEEVSNILDAWHAFGSIKTGVQPWPISGIFSPIVIRAFQQHVRDYQVNGDHLSGDVGILNLFLKKGDEICSAYRPRPIVPSSKVQSEQCEDEEAVVSAPMTNGTVRLSDLEMTVLERGTAAVAMTHVVGMLGDTENPRSYVNKVYQKWKDIAGKSYIYMPESVVRDVVRDDIEKRLPSSVQTMLKQVIGLSVMDRQLYTENIAHYVELHRKRKADWEAEALEIQRKLNAAELAALIRREERDRVQPTGPRQGPGNGRVLLLGSDVCCCPPASIQPRTGRRYNGCFSCGSLSHFVKDCTVRRTPTQLAPGHMGHATVRSRCNGPQVQQFSPRGGHSMVAPAGGSNLDRAFYRSASTTGAYKVPVAGIRKGV